MNLPKLGNLITLNNIFIYMTARENNSKKLLLSLVILAMLIVAEAIGGFITGSLVLLSDAAHLFADFFALLLSWFSLYLVNNKSPNNKYSFGYYRMEVMAAFVNSSALFVIALFISIEAGKRIWLEPAAIVDWKPVLGLAVLSLIVNFILLCILHSDHKDNLNMRSAVLHIIGDLMGSAATILSALVIKFTGWSLIDPVMSIFISCLILYSAYRLVRDSLRILLEGTPFNISYEKVRQYIMSNIKGVLVVHHMHAWSLSEDKALITLHVKVDLGLIDYKTVVNQIRHILKEEFNITHSTIELEYNNFEEGCKLG